MKSAKWPIIQSDDQFNRTISHGKLTLLLDPSYDPEWNRRQWGIMAADWGDLKKGEKVYFHYLTLDDIPDLPPDKWVIRQPEFTLYCVIRDSQIVPLYGTVMVEIIKEGLSSDIIITLQDDVYNRGIVRYADSDQVKDGDEILFHPRNAFRNVIEGKEYYIMEEIDMLAKVI